MGALMPFWAIIVPFCFGLFLAMILKNPGAIAPVPAAMLLVVLAFLPVVAVMMSAFCEDDRIVVSKDGILFPLMMLPVLNFKRERFWEDIAEARLIRDGAIASTATANPSGWLILTFRSGGSVRLNLRSINKADMEQFLLAIEIWAKQCKREQALIDFQNELQNESRGIEQLSYTQMWEEELSRRFSATAFVPLEPDTKLRQGGIRIIRQLAFGGLSAIYLAQHDERDLVIIKEAVVPANADEASRAKAAEMFEREAQLLVRLNHPYIAKVYDHFVEDGRNYLMLQYIRGQDLRQLIKQNGPQPEEVVIEWAAQIASLLDYLHNQSPPIIHRDLTPDNLVRREDGAITLIDFGAANEFVGTATGTLVGKQAYIAPEQLRGKATTHSDIYAFGGTLYYLLTGRDPEALDESHPREVVPEVSAALDELVFKCTQMEAVHRPQSAGEIAGVVDRMIQEHDRQGDSKPTDLGEVLKVAQAQPQGER